MNRKTYKSLGLMSGTSMDGIDAAIIETDGHSVTAFGAGRTFPYTNTFRNKICELINGSGDKDLVSRELTELHAFAANELLRISGESKDSIDYIGFHGHTIFHRPKDGITVQIGDGKLLRDLTGINVVNDFRSADVKAGGQGAPLVPIYHQALLQTQKKPIAVVNIGGVANITWIGNKEGELLAFDTGPGNALLDDWVKLKTGHNFDEGGKLARNGTVDQPLLAQFMSDNFFALKLPKSLDRNHFHAIPSDYLITTEDGAATLAAFTAQSIAKAEEFFPKKAVKWLVAGGGRHNYSIMYALRALLPCPVEDINGCGIDGDMLEAQAFAFLAVRTALGLPISFPGTTGVAKPLCGGVITLAK